MRLTKHGKKWTEEALTRTAKAKEVGFREWEISLYKAVIGKVNKTRYGYEATDNKGKRLGMSNSKKEARFFVAWEFVGDESMNWKEDQIIK